MRARLGVLTLAIFLVLGASPASVDSKPYDAAALYNQGTEALRRGDLGPAVALLAAARRIDPRAGDIRNRASVRAGALLHARARDGQVGPEDRKSVV